ncbi:hypothetical protein [Cyanobium sp. Morenito 9A2]
MFEQEWIRWCDEGIVSLEGQPPGSIAAPGG